MHNYEELKYSHPCFGGHKNQKGRIHLPVSPGCNIECRFCDRKINETEQRPGVTSVILKPDEAVEAVRKALELCPDISVVGIAGPGDTLATDNALKTFRLIRSAFPGLINCMSTNGLLLPERADEVIELIDSLTVTVNAVDAKIEAQLNDAVFYHGKKYYGEEAAAILIENQLKGIQKVADAGVTVKVNTVLAPGINDDHIEEIAMAVSDAGAKIYNIIPLIPQHKLSDLPAPDCMQIETVRQQAGQYIDVFRHCQHCRADAVGIPGGKDYGDQIYLKRLSGQETFSHG